MVLDARVEAADTSVISVAADDAVANEADEVHVKEPDPAELNVRMPCNCPSGALHPGTVNLRGQDRGYDHRIYMRMRGQACRM